MHGFGDEKIQELVQRTKEWDWSDKEAFALAWIRDGFKLAKAMGFQIHYDADHVQHSEIDTEEIGLLEPCPENES